jgi:hypothetical protein
VQDQRFLIRFQSLGQHSPHELQMSQRREARAAFPFGRKGKWKAATTLHSP